MLPLLLEDIKKDRTLHKARDGSLHRPSRAALPSQEAELEYRMLQDLVTHSELPPTSASQHQEILGPLQDAQAASSSTVIGLGPNPNDPDRDQDRSRKRKRIGINFVLLREMSHLPEGGGD